MYVLTPKARWFETPMTLMGVKCSGTGNSKLTLPDGLKWYCFVPGRAR